MLIEVIDEENYKEKVEEGTKAVDDKIKQIERQANSGNINWNLFFDPTIWAYKVLKDKQNNLLKLRGFQDKVLNDRHRFIVVAGANQIGKTFGIAAKAIHHAVHVDNASVIIVSKSEPQAIMVLDEIKWMLKRANISFDSIIGDVENRTELHIKSQDGTGVSVIRCLPPTTTILGYPATLIICDEIAFWEIDNMDPYEFFWRVIVSRTNSTKNLKNKHFTMGQIFCISNTNGQQGILWSLWNHSDFHQYRYNFLANPDNTIEEYEKLKIELPSDWFDSIYAASFSSTKGGFITMDEWKDAAREYKTSELITSSIYMGGDFAGEDTRGRDVDQSVLVGVIPVKDKEIDKLQVVYLNDFPIRTKKEAIYDELLKFKILKFAYDKVGVGDSVKNDLKIRGQLSEYQIEALTYSLPNKSEVYYNLKHLFEQRKIIVPNDKKLKEQLMGLKFELTKGGHLDKPMIKVHHATEKLHDDFPDALANACYVAKILKGAEPYIGTTKRHYSSAEHEIKDKQTLICPECEKIDYEGKSGYYRGKSPSGQNFEKIPCPRHLITI